MEALFQLIKHIEGSILDCVEETQSDDASYIDAVDKKEISGHYAMTHAAAGMILLANYTSDDELYDRGIKLVKKILRTHSEDIQLLDYHFDFNNFALCLIYDVLKTKDEELADEIKQTVILTADSNHDTVNWLPMRMAVNMCRYFWTGDEAYKNNANDIECRINEAAYDDGFVDDRYPKGLSFNLQYDISTVAVLIMIAHKCEIKSNLSRMVGALLGAVCPDGDINYLGRGTNQIFAWGPWMYILSNLPDKAEFEKALKYFFRRAEIAVLNDNIFLNGRNGKEKYMWWDYHYSSVYTGHLYMWLVLAYINENTVDFKPSVSKTCDSGVRVLKTNNAFVTLFSGRKEYLAEAGPMVSAIGHSKFGMIFKGGFGPYQGSFGNKYSDADALMHSFVGILRADCNSKVSQNRILRKLGIDISARKFLKISPAFTVVKAKIYDNSISIVWEFKKPVTGIFNLPVLKNSKITLQNIKLLCDGTESCLSRVGSVFNQYDENFLFQSKKVSAKSWELIIS